MKLFVWDFHGVLEQGNDQAVVAISNHILEQAGYKERFTKEEGARLYGLKWHEYFATLLPHKSKQLHLDLQTACFAYAEANIDIIERHIKPTPHARSVLQAIAKAGHDQILISNSRPQDLVWFLEAVALKKYFPAAKRFGVNKHEQYSDKISVLKTYLERKDFADIVIVGDTQADMNLRRAGGGTTYLYSRANSVYTSVEGEADYVISDLRQLLKEANN